MKIINQTDLDLGKVPLSKRKEGGKELSFREGLPGPSRTLRVQRTLATCTQSGMLRASDAEPLACEQDLRLQPPVTLGRAQCQQESSAQCCTAGRTLPSLAWGLATQSVFTGRLGGLRAQASGHFLLKSVVSGTLNPSLPVPMHASRP